MSKDIFIIPRKKINGEYIIYAPLQNIAFLGNKRAVEIVDKYIKGCEVTDEEKETIVWDYLTKIEAMRQTLPESKTIGSESSVVIILSQSCNLACTYCYAQEARSSKILSKDKLKIVIDDVLSRSLLIVDFVFIGGGEPLIAWELIKWAIKYIYDNKKNSTQVNITITTNATLLTDEKIWYLKKYNVHLGISFDILPRVQNTQRQFANLKCGSFDIVNAVIENIDNAKISYSFRSTITKLNVELMPEMVRFVETNYKNVKKLHFEPVLSSIDNDQAFYNVFIESFMKAREFGLKNGIIVYNSISNSIDKLNSRFCRGEFCITPTGAIVACHRISSENEPAFKFVNYGFVNEQVNFNLSQRSEVYKRFNEKYEKCATCFAKWHCAGGCLADKLVQSPEQQQQDKCYFTKSLIALLLEERLTNNNLLK